MQIINIQYVMTEWAEKNNLQANEICRWMLYILIFRQNKKHKYVTKVVIIIKCSGHVFKNITIYTGIVINTIINNYEL